MGEYLSQNEAETGALAAVLAKKLIPGDLILLRGGLGAGKTAFVRALLRTLADDENFEVPSPTFSIVQPYRIAGLSIIHADLFRLCGAHEVDELGLFDDQRDVVLVEWPERCPDLAGSASIEIVFSPAPSAHGPDHRHVRITAMCSERGAQLDGELVAARFLPLETGRTGRHPQELEKLQDQVALRS